MSNGLITLGFAFTGNGIITNGFAIAQNNAGDTTRPTVMSVGVDPGGLTGQVFFDESVSGSGIIYFTVDGAPVAGTLSGSGSVRSIAFGTKIYIGQVVLWSVQANAFNDTAGNQILAANGEADNNSSQVEDGLVTGNPIVQLVRGPIRLKSSGRISEEGYVGDTLPLMLQFVDDLDRVLSLDGATLKWQLSQFGALVTSSQTVPSGSIYAPVQTFRINVELPSIQGIARLTVTRDAGANDKQTAEILINVRPK